MTTYYRWTTRGWGNHCGGCNHWAGQVKSGDEWAVLAQPPLHQGCGCSLQVDHEDEEPEPDGPPEGLPGPPCPSGANDETPPGSPAPGDAGGPAYPPGTPPVVYPPPASGDARTGGNKGQGKE